MDKRGSWFGCVVIGLALLTAPALWAQDNGKRTGEPAKGGAHDEGAASEGVPTEGAPAMSAEDIAMMQEWMKLAAPGEHHKHLEHFVGNWDTTTKMWMGGPGSNAMESKGTSTVKWVLGGRYTMEEHHGSMMGMPYEGLGLTGYDNVKNLYVSTWSSNMDTQLLTMMGSRHPETGIFTFYGKMDEPSMNVHGRTVKYVTQIVDPNKHVFTIYDLHVSDDYKVIEITYERKK